ncbi:MAG: hydrogenase maturation protease [Acidimicrobiales bacterium]
MTGEDTQPGPALVLGVGNRDRGDDAVGPIVAELMARRWPDGLEAVVVEGDLSTLALRWRPEHRVAVVDAMVSGAAPGTTVAIGWPPAGAAGRSGPVGVGSSPASTHSIGLAAALELARLLGRLPAAVTVVGVEGTAFELLAPLSPAVAAAVEPVVALVASLLDLPQPQPGAAVAAAGGSPAGPGLA